MEMKDYLYEIIDSELFDEVTLTKDLDCDLESVYDDIPNKYRVRDYLLKSGNYGELILLENTADYYDSDGWMPKTIDIKLEEITHRIDDGEIRTLKLEHTVGQIDLRSGYVTIKVYSNHIVFSNALLLMNDVIELITTVCEDK